VDHNSLISEYNELIADKKTSANDYLKVFSKFLNKEIPTIPSVYRIVSPQRLNQLPPITTDTLITLGLNIVAKGIAKEIRLT
jgi:hypothetical protein